ncbi:hypothetical protein FOL01_0893 [Weissella jogaejeotgali]|uniref:Single-stranded DNA-binding protein n=1 Tax=Weissella jogaejeotgali TaxID=1631871 RepID=A0A1L6RB96_9LACO|nr:single-stranded DNA-binding protein [Weissella jogaejeotgali]APS41752.1 hypothetical protein FOL01_0893 [Weissella jogaejeotgali]
MQTNIHVGRLVKEFELQIVGEQQDIKMVRFGLAVQRYLSKKARTDFIYYVAFGKTAEMLYQYANKKGVPIEVQFNIQSEVYEITEGQSQYRATNVVTSFMPWTTKQSEKEIAKNDGMVDGNESTLQGLNGLTDEDLEIR